MNYQIESRIKKLNPEQLSVLSRKLLKIIEAKGKRKNIKKRDNLEEFPMSSAQKRLWFLNQLNSGSANYNIFSALKLEGSLDIEALNKALNEVISRHEILRSVYTAKGNEPVQTILGSVSIKLDLTDLSGLDEAAKDDSISSVISEEAKKPFDLSQGPLIRGSVIKLDEKEHILLLTIHHIAADGWSFNILISEVAILYKAYVSQNPPILNELPIQYPDFADWQNEYIKSEAVQKQLVFWKNRLQEMPQSLDLPLDNHRQSVKTFQGARCYFKIPKELKEPLMKLGHEQSATLYMTFLASFQVFLYRITGQKDFGVGIPIANRNRPEIENLIGFFVNTMVIRADLKNNTSFREVISNVREFTTAAYDNQDLPFEKVVESIQTTRDISSSPLFQVMFDLQDLPLRKLSVDDLSFSMIDVDNQTSKLDLLLLIEDEGSGLRGILEYDTAIFKASTIEMMSRVFQILLREMVLNPDKNINDLKVLSEEDEDLLISKFNDTTTDYPDDLPVNKIFEKTACLFPDKTAVEENGNIYSYQELNARSNQFARYLLKNGVRIDVPVVVFMERSFDMIVAIMAILKTGGVYVPVDTGYPKARLKLMLDDIKSPLIISKSSFLGLLPETRLEILAIDIEQQQIYSEAPDNLNDNETEVSAGPTDLAYIIYTSGSTGIPKGVAITHRGISRLVLNTNYISITHEDRISHLSNVTFDAATFEIWGTLLNGASMVIINKDDVLSTRKFIRLIKQNRITAMFITTALFNQVANEDADAFSSVNYLLFGGESADIKSVEKILNGRRPEHFYNMYGPTECTTFSTYYPIGNSVKGKSNIPIGKSISNSTTYILDIRQRLVPVGVSGELCIGGDGLADRYLDRPDLTAEKFTPDPFSGRKGARLYRTGDLVRHLPDGNIEFIGRIDNQIKLRGFRIELGEIETVLRSHSSLSDAVVLLREDVTGNKKLTAYVVTASGSLCSAADLRAYLSEKLPEYMIPSYFVTMNSFPTTLSGKIDKKALPKPDFSFQETSKTYVAPRTKLEKYLAEVWREILGVKDVGRYDNFFELGGNSIQAAVLMNRLQKEFSEEAHVKAIFLAPTIAELALYINEYYPDQAKKIFGEDDLAEINPSLHNNRYPLNPAHPVNPAPVNPVLVDPAQAIEELKSIIKIIPSEARNYQKKNPKAVFVLSPPRSGSTLLRVMLAGNPKLFSPPELELLSFNTLRERRDALKSQYNLWLEATIRAVMEIKGCSSDEAEAIMYDLENKDLTIKEFYGLLQDWIGDKILIDKTPSYSLSREILTRAEEYFEDALFIHLMRHPYASIYSFVEAKLDKTFFRYPHRFNSRELAELIWIISHQNIMNFLEGIPEKRKCVIRFEDLLQNPKLELEKICSLIGVGFHPDMLRPYEGRKMTDPARENSQMVGDYKFYLRNKIDTNAIERWKKFHFQDFLSDIAWDIAEKFSYSKGNINGDNNAGKGEQRKQLKEIEPISRDKDLILSYAQQRLWFLDQLDPNSPFYNISSAFKLLGSFDEKALVRSLNKIVKRHEILRTTFPSIDGKPEVVIHNTISCDYRSIDISSFTGEDADRKISELITAESKRSFDIARGPLFGVLLIRVNEKANILVLTMHHIISDGWSMSVLFNEITYYYHTFKTAENADLPDLPVQYIDYAFWQREYLKGEKLKKQSEYWQKRLDDIPKLINLPLDYPRPAVQRHLGDRVSYVISKDDYGKIIELCNKYNVTPFMLFVAAVQVLLHKYSGQTDICLGTPVAGRSIKELESLIGFFANTVVLRGNLSGNPSFSDFLKDTYNLTIEALSNQDLPFEKLVDLLQPERDMSYTPLFQVMLSHNKSPLQGRRFDDLDLVPIKIFSKVSKFDLLIEITERDDAFKIEYEYNTDLFKESTISRMADHMMNLLNVIIQSPESRISEFSLLASDEYNKITEMWNSENTKAELDQTFPSLFEYQAMETPDALAVEYEDESLTFLDLNQRSNQLARYLRDRGIGPEKFVIICLDRSVELLTSIIGVLKSGGAYVPLDPSYPKERISTVLKEFSEVLVITKNEFSDLFTGLDSNSLVIWEKDQSKIKSEPVENIQIILAKENPAYMIFTSGSTGIPKGVIIQHNSLLNLFLSLKENIYSGYNKKMRVSLNAPVFFDASLQQIVMLLDGHTLVILPQEVRGSGSELMQYIRTKRIDVLDCVPSQLKLLIDEGLLETGNYKPLVCLPGGEAIDQKIWHQLQKQTEIEFFNMYGPTECTVDSIFCHVNKSHEVPNIGRPVFNTEVYILDQYMHPVPVGVQGEIYLGGAAVGRGYYNFPDMTADKYLPNPFRSGGERIYKTGDLGRFMEDGTVEYSGRADHQVKIRGFRIEITEIENALKNHPQIKDALADTFEDKSGNKRLISYICFREKDSMGSVSELREFLKNRLPDYMIPSIFIFLEEMPMTLNGKIDRKKLPRADEKRPELNEDYLKPENEIEIKLAEIWKQVLQIDEAGVNDNFFELGGDSIMSIQVVAKANQSGIKLTSKQMFLYPTIRGLAKAALDAIPVVADQSLISGEIILSPVQHMFFENNFKEKDHWNQVNFFRTEEKLDAQILEKAFNEILKHHDILRARYYTDENTIHQVINEEHTGKSFYYVSFNEPFIDEKGNENIDLINERMIKEINDIQNSFKLSEGPLIKLACFEGSQNSYVFISAHHLVIDSVSWRILLEDLWTVYKQLQKFQNPILPLKTTSYKSWTEKLFSVAHTEEVTKELDFWMNNTPKVPVDIPVDLNLPLTENIEQSVEMGTVSLCKEDTELMLHKLQSKYDIKVNEILIAALYKTILDWGKTDEFYIDIEGHGREELFSDVDLSRTLGWFTSIYPLYLKSEEVLKNSFSMMIPVVKQQFRTVAEKGMSFGLLKYLNEQTSGKMKEIPSPTISFNYLGQFNQNQIPNFRIYSAIQPEERHPMNQRQYLLDFTASIMDDKLILNIRYSKVLYLKETISLLANSYIENLHEMIYSLLGTNDLEIANPVNPVHPVNPENPAHHYGLDQDQYKNILDELEEEQNEQ